MPSASTQLPPGELDVERVRADFPIFSRPLPGPPLAYLDSAATSLKPQAVVDAITEVYANYTGNVGRGIHRLSNEATDRFEGAREEVAAFINAGTNEIAFVRNATEAVNLVARSLPAEAAVLTTLAEHHSNLLPWKVHHPTTFCAVLPDGRVDIDDFERQIKTNRPQVVAVSHISNALGALNPLEDLIRIARKNGAVVFLDASQSVPHRPFDVTQVDCDYACFSGHKMLGPSGIGVLYAKPSAMASLQALNVGGGTVENVSQESFTWRRAPWRLEAGTPFIEGAIGLAAACEYLESCGRAAINEHLHDLVGYGLRKLKEVPDVTLRGPLAAEHRGATITWTMNRIDVHTVARILSDRFNICVRSGYHCAEPIHRFLDLGPTLRASFYLYNSRDEIDRLADALRSISDHREA